MKLEEVEREGEGQKARAAKIDELAAEHHRDVELHKALHAQLDRLSGDLGSSDLDQAERELSRSDENLRAEGDRLEQERQALLHENSELMGRIDQAHSKAKKGKNFLVEGLKQEGVLLLKGIAGEIVKPLSDIGLIPEPGRQSDSLERVAQATERHVERLEAAKKQLLEARQLLEGIRR